MSDFAPVPPGDVLRIEFIEPLGLDARALASAVCVTPETIESVISGVRAIDAALALRLGRYFGTSGAFWLNLQNRYDLEVTKRRIKLGLAAISPHPTTDPHRDATASRP